ncbi:sigma-70 region 4 domain-containing protein [Streptomyces sp. NA02950]|uniref:sigma-70 region 4 domain-containing protein n=1 Tax=Streptomyces sp. NA02950 TaxID=2742137 RepID=UPI0015923F69|nr:sigma-70 region 4 domain-containing protein [Streptomyces sp. NA02950]QKV90438.1 sigma-70 region 4 domain-containing protein [Streptomyces sp. NA02950]QKV97229.1 sigma-70 region 4 domain-containing protein [Streptomyces sp. NA02950]
MGAAFDSLGCRWPEALSSACPAAFSWRLLGRCVSEADRAEGAADESLGGLYGVLPAEQADAVLLHYRLGMTLTAGADLMGISSSVMAAHLLMAERSLPRWLSTALRPPEAGTLWGRR